MGVRSKHIKTSSIFRDERYSKQTGIKTKQREITMKLTWRPFPFGRPKWGEVDCRFKLLCSLTQHVWQFFLVLYIFFWRWKKKQPIYSRQIGNDGVHLTHQIHSHPENIPKNWSNKDAREMYPSRWSRDSFQYNNIYFILKIIDFPQVQGKKKKAEHQTEVATYTFLHPRWHPLPCTPARRMWRLARRHQFPFWL